jgi:hypothetical protein
MTTLQPTRSSVALLPPRTTAASRELARDRVIFWAAHRSRVVRRSGSLRK